MQIGFSGQRLEMFRMIAERRKELWQDGHRTQKINGQYRLMLPNRSVTFTAVNARSNRLLEVRGCLLGHGTRIILMNDEASSNSC